MKNLVQFMLLGIFVSTMAGAVEAPQPQADFELPALGQQEPVSLSDFRGQWVVVNYWATWCAPCRKEIPELSELHAARDDVTVLGLAYEDNEEANFQGFLAEYQPSYPILLPDVYAMPDGLDTPRVLPTTFLVNPEGLRVRTILGPITREELEKFIASAAESQGP